MKGGCGGGGEAPGRGEIHAGGMSVKGKKYMERTMCRWRKSMGGECEERKEMLGDLGEVGGDVGSGEEKC